MIDKFSENIHPQFTPKPVKTEVCKKTRNPATIAVTGFFVELLGRFELPTSSLPRMRSTY